MDGIKPVFIYPLLGTLLMEVIGRHKPDYQSAIHFLQWTWGILVQQADFILSIILATMMATDIGGPFNKAAYAIQYSSKCKTATLGLWLLL